MAPARRQSDNPGDGVRHLGEGDDDEALQACSSCVWPAGHQGHRVLSTAVVSEEIPVGDWGQIPESAMRDSRQDHQPKLYRRSRQGRTMCVQLARARTRETQSSSSSKQANSAARHATPAGIRSPGPPAVAHRIERPPASPRRDFSRIPPLVRRQRILCPILVY